uniref:Uncharacterized protein n=1 Tax=Candidozyma auris TaxID=498019 RepID=A0A0L0NUP2_CANAR
MPAVGAIFTKLNPPLPRAATSPTKSYNYIHTPKSLASNNSLIDETWKELLKRSDTYFLDNPLADIKITSSSTSLHSARTIPTRNDGVPILLSKRETLERFPEIREPEVTEPDNNLRIVTAERFYLRELEKIYYTKNLWKRSGWKMSMFSVRAMRARIRARIRAYIRSRRNREVESSLQNVNATHVDCYFELESDTEADCVIYSQPLQVPKKRQAQKNSSRYSRCSLPEEESNCDRWNLMLPSPTTCSQAKIKSLTNPCVYSQVDPYVGNRHNSLITKWDKETSQNFTTVVLRELYGTVIGGLLRSSDANRLAKQFLDSIHTHVDWGFKKAVDVALQAHEAIEVCQRSFNNESYTGLTQASYGRGFHVKLLEQHHAWTWDLPPLIHGNFELSTLVALDTNGQFECVLHNEQKPLLPVRLSKVFSKRKTFQGAPQLCNIADKLLQTAQEIYGEINGTEQEYSSCTLSSIGSSLEQ